MLGILCSLFMTACVKAPITLSEGQAREIALKLVWEQKLPWKKIDAIVEREKEFWVTYVTPDKESRRIGPRVVLVDKVSGKARMLPRR